jgi:hypothetical protein
VTEKSEIQASLTQWDPRYHGSKASRNEALSLGMMLHKLDWGHDITCVKPLENVIEKDPMTSDSNNNNSNNNEVSYLCAKSEPFHKHRSVSFKETVSLDPGKYVLVPMTFDPLNKTQSAASRQCWLSFFSKSPLYPVKMYSDAEIEYDDPNRVLEVKIINISFFLSSFFFEHFKSKMSGLHNNTICLIIIITIIIIRAQLAGSSLWRISPRYQMMRKNPMKPWLLLHWQSSLVRCGRLQDSCSLGKLIWKRRLCIWRRRRGGLMRKRLKRVESTMMNNAYGSSCVFVCVCAEKIIGQGGGEGGGGGYARERALL